MQSIVKTVQSALISLFGIKPTVEYIDTPVEGHQFTVTTLVRFKGHDKYATGWRNGTPAQIADSLRMDGSAPEGCYISIAGQRWKVWSNAITPVDPAHRVRKGDRRRDRNARPNPCEAGREKQMAFGW
jgi:hypothetical protein